MSEVSETKVCTLCGQEKPFHEFHKFKHGKFGLKATCKECNSAEAKRWRLENKDKANATKRTYRAKNKDKMSDYFRARYLTHKDEVKAANKRWRDENPEKVKVMVKAAQINNREANKLVQHKRRARKMQSGGNLSVGLAKKLFEYQKGLCPCCGLPLGDDYHMDHIVPLALGGTNTDDNIQLLRAKCNLQKNAKHPVDFMQSRGFLL